MDALYHLSAYDLIALLGAVALKGALIFCLAFFASGLLRRASAATRHVVWTLALAAALLLPALFLALPGWHVPVLPARPQPVEAFAVPPVAPLAPAPPKVWLQQPAVRVAPGMAVAPRMHVEVHPLPGGHEAFVLRREVPPHVFVEPTPQGPLAAWLGGLPGPLRDGRAWVLLAWLAGALYVAARWAGASLGAWRLVRDAEPVFDRDWQELKERLCFGMDLDRPVRLLRSNRLAVPIAWGIFNPVVLLPADADAWDEDRREVVLTHELAHIVRWDCLTQVVAQAALVLHWFNPLAWLAYRRFLLEREHACDDYVLSFGAAAADYADHLVQIARRFRQESLALLAVAPMARRSNLEGRILSILDPERNRSAFGRMTLAVAAVLALGVVLPLAALRPVEAAPPEPFSVATASMLDFAPAPTYAFKTSDNAWSWEGRVSSGGFVEVRGVNGSIRARAGSGDRVRVEAQKESKGRGRAEDVEIVVREFANGVVVCAVYPGQQGECAPGESPSGSVRDNDVTVRFEVEVPQTVRFVAHTVNGSIKTSELGADVDARTTNGSIETTSRSGNVEAYTTNGSVRATAGGVVRAGTTNGSIDARFGRADWDGELALETTNGSITLALPGNLSTSVQAQTQTGSIQSDFPLDIRRTGFVGAEAEGRIGQGGRRLRLQTLHGGIQLRSASGAMGAVYRTPGAVMPDIVHDSLLIAQHEHAREAAMVALAHAKEMLREVEPELRRLMSEHDWAAMEAEVTAEVEAALAELDAELASSEETQAELEAALREAEVELQQALQEVEMEMQRALQEAQYEIQYEAQYKVQQEAEACEDEQP